MEALLGHMAAPAFEDASWVLHGPEAVARVVSEVDHPLGERRGGAGAHLVLPFGRELPQKITRSDDDMNRGRPERVGHAVDLLVRRSNHQLFADHRFPWVLVDLVDQRLPGPWGRWSMPVAAANLSHGVEVRPASLEGQVHSQLFEFGLMLPQQMLDVGGAGLRRPDMEEHSVCHHPSIAVPSAGVSHAKRRRQVLGSPPWPLNPDSGTVMASRQAAGVRGSEVPSLWLASEGCIPLGTGTPRRAPLRV